MIFLSLAAVGGCKNGSPEKTNLSKVLGVGKNKPNIIIFLIDAMRPDHLSAYGYSRNTSPHINKFASDSIVFTNAYSQCSWTRPSVGVLFTGQYPSSHGAIGREDSLDSRLPTLAGLMKISGYETAAFSANPNVFPEYGFKKGFDVFFKIEAPKYYATADRVNESIFKFLDKRSSKKPLFMFVHTMDAHYPYIPPKPYSAKYSGAPIPAKHSGISRQALELMNRYDGGISFDDLCFGKLIDRLKSKGMYDNSIIILMSDHGEEFEDHGGLYHGWTLYEELVRIPLIIKLPESRRAGARSKHTVRIIDIMPTIAELMNTKDFSRMYGKSFLPSLAGVETKSSPANLYAEENLDGHVLRSWTDDGIKLIDEQSPKKNVYLFDLKSDSAERKNLAASENTRVAALTDRMNNFASLFRQGFSLEFINGRPPLEIHSIRGYLKIAGGKFIDAGATDTEEDDSIVIDKSGQSIHFRFLLKNRPNPVRIDPPVLHDAEKIYFKVSSPGARLRLQLETAGDAVPVERILLGSGAVPDGNLKMPLEFRAADSALVLSPGAAPLLPPEKGGFACRFYRIPEVSSRKVKINEDQKRRLRDLGYIR